MLLSKRNDLVEWELFDSCPKDRIREFIATILQPYQNFWHLDTYVQLLKKEVTVEILH